MAASNPKSRKQPLLAALFLTLALSFLGYEIQGSGPLTAQVFDGDGLLGGLQQARRELGGSGIREEVDLTIVVVGIINALLPYAAVAALLTFITAGFFFILGFGSDNAVQRAKKMMIWSAVGLVVIIFSYVLTQFVINASSA